MLQRPRVIYFDAVEFLMIAAGVLLIIAIAVVL
jgi:hypothetical protein